MLFGYVLPVSLENLIEQFLLLLCLFLVELYKIEAKSSDISSESVYFYYPNCYFQSLQSSKAFT